MNLSSFWNQSASLSQALVSTQTTNNYNQQVSELPLLPQKQVLVSDRPDNNVENPEDLDDAPLKYFKRQEPLFIQKGHKFSDPKLFVDFSHFPMEFVSVDKALQVYNQLGLLLKIQFKKYNIRRNETGFITMFSFCCHVRQSGPNKVFQGVQLKPKEFFECPVQVKFKWSQERLTYYRSRSMVMQHNHALLVKDRHTVISSPQMLRDIEVFAKCKLSVANITKILNCKYKEPVRYQDVYGIVKQLSQQQSSLCAIKEEQSEFELMLEQLEAKRATDPFKMHFAYRVSQGRTTVKDVQVEDVEGLYFQLPQMHQNFKAFPELMFIDSSVKQKQRQMNETEEENFLHLVVLSGVNNEGQNVMFGCGILNELTAESLTWLLDNFRQSNMQAGEHAVFLGRGMAEAEYILDPDLVLSDCSEAINTAVEVVFSHRTTHLYCQKTIKAYLREQFAFLLDCQPHRRISNPKDLFSLILDLVDEPSAQRFTGIQEALFSLGMEFFETKHVTTLRKLLSVKEKWATAFTPLKFTCGTHNLNRALRISKLINSRLFGCCKMMDLYRLIEDIDAEAAKPSLQTQADSQLVLHHPLLRELRLHCTCFAFKHMLYEFAESHYMKVSAKSCQAFLRGQARTIKIIDSRSWQIYALKLRSKQSSIGKAIVGCSCEFNQSFGLLCGHIFAVFNLFQVKRIVKVQVDLIRERWLRQRLVDDDQYSKMAVIDDEDLLCENPYQIKLTTKDRLSGADQTFGAGFALDGHLILCQR